jgi:interferon gamma-inducible protein 30
MLFDLEMVPYGNAKEDQRANGIWNFTCQHGPLECVGNLHEACMISLTPNITITFPIIECAESSNQFETDPASALRSCAKRFAYNYDPVDACVNGPAGNNYQHQMAVKTGNLNPPHQFVPWIIVNGSHDYQDQAESNLLAVVCHLYTGTKPPACSMF